MANIAADFQLSNRTNDEMCDKINICTKHFDIPSQFSESLSELK